MAIKFIDGCTHYYTDDIDYKWHSHSGTGVSASTPRRSGTKSLSLSVNNWIRSKALDGFTSRVVMGAAINRAGAGPGGFQVMKESTVQLTLAWSDTGVMQVIRGDAEGAVLATTSGSVLSTGEWVYIELDATIDDVTGAVEVRINGSEVEDLTLTSVDTKPGVAAGANGIKLYCEYSAFLVTDIYVDTDTFQGDCVIDTILPTGVGTHTDFTPSTGSNYENVDDDGNIDDDDTYNASTTQDHIDSFAYGNLTPMESSGILAVAVNMAVRKDDNAGRQVSALTRVGSTDYVHGTPKTVSGSYSIGQSIWEDNPADSQAWQEADVNGAEFGYKQTLVN